MEGQSIEAVKSRARTFLRVSVLLAAVILLPQTICGVRAGTARKQPPGISRSQGNFIPLQRTVVAGKSVQIGFVTSLNPDCSVTGDIDVRIIELPRHGVASIQQGSDFPTFKKENIRSVCNDRKVPGYVITYASVSEFVGNDQVVVQSIDDRGFKRLFGYAIEVAPPQPRNGAPLSRDL